MITWRYMRISVEVEPEAAPFGQCSTAVIVVPNVVRDGSVKTSFTDHMARFIVSGRVGGRGRVGGASTAREQTDIFDPA